MIGPEVDSFFDEPTSTASLVVADPVTKRCAVIEPVLGYDPDSGCTDSVSRTRLSILSRPGVMG